MAEEPPSAGSPRFVDLFSATPSESLLVCRSMVSAERRSTGTEQKISIVMSFSYGYFGHLTHALAIILTAGTTTSCCNL